MLHLTGQLLIWIIALYSENHSKRAGVVCGQNAVTSLKTGGSFTLNSTLWSINFFFLTLTPHEQSSKLEVFLCSASYHGNSKVLFQLPPDRIWGPHFPAHLVLMVTCSWIKQTEHKADCCTLSSAKVKKRGDISAVYFLVPLWCGY